MNVAPTAEIIREKRMSLSRWKIALLIGMALIIVLGSGTFLIARLSNHANAPAHPTVLGNSNSAMFGFDLQHTHFNAAEHTLNAANVSRLVSYWTATTGSYVISSPVVANGIVYIGSYDQKLYALDANTGNILWVHNTKSSIGSSPAIAQGIVYIGSNDHKLYALNA